jgi:acyl-CoA thioesterase-1
VSIRSVCLLLCLVLVLGSPAARADPPIILVVGDSLSAAYGIRLEQGWVSLLQRRLEAEGYGHRVVNASTSGETTGGALARLPRALERHRPDIVILELGANDGLRGLPIPQVRANFDSMLRLSRSAGSRILLVGMRIPPNYGPAYTAAFDSMYRELAAANDLPLVPFLLDGVALDDSLMQSDGLHPNAAAQPKLLDTVWPKLQPLLRQ